MSPRPRETSDEEILAATGRVMQRLGPTQITLADVAKEAGVVPATLIQRFKSKRGLLLETCKTAPDAVPRQFAAARAKHSSPLAVLIELYADCSAFAPTPEAMANGLAYLQVDLTDPEFHAITLAQFRATREETQRLLDEAVTAGELADCDTEELAGLLQQLNDGAMLSWAVYREGTLDRWVRREVEALLRPYRVISPAQKLVRKPAIRGRRKH
ncbi:MAG TPA: TetR/AcrR family transcriptional regulator [Candidatus Acidoferrum sp.]|jgi:AcrR family transcriptional regulator